MDIYSKFKTELEPLARGNGAIAVAVSGGSDSMALSLLLALYAKESGREVIAITVDHQLRPASASEAQQVSTWLGEYHISHHVICWEGEKKSSNIQALARRARYRLMADFCVSRNIKTLAVAHTVSDQAETVLMNIMRGSGVDGLSGIAAEKEISGIRVIRPLLKFHREDLREYLYIYGQEWIDDPSNENDIFTRVQTRRFIASSPEASLLVERLAATATHMARARHYIEACARARLGEVLKFHEEGFYTIDRAKFITLHDEECLRALSVAIHHVGGQEYKPRFENLLFLYQNIVSDTIAGGLTLGGCIIALSKKKNEGELLFIYREPGLVAGDIHIANAYKTGDTIEWDGRFACAISSIDIAGLSIGTLGKEGYEGIVKSGFDTSLIHKKYDFTIPKKIFYALPAMKVGKKILAVPHVGYYAYADTVGTITAAWLHQPALQGFHPSQDRQGLHPCL